MRRREMTSRPTCHSFDASSRTIVWESPHGRGMAAFCFISGAALFAAESFTFMRDTPIVWPCLQKVCRGLAQRKHHDQRCHLPPVPDPG